MGVRYRPRAAGKRPSPLATLAATRYVGTGALCRLVSLSCGVIRSTPIRSYPARPGPVRVASAPRTAAGLAVKNILCRPIVSAAADPALTALTEQEYFARRSAPIRAAVRKSRRECAFEAAAIMCRAARISVVRAYSRADDVRIIPVLREPSALIAYHRGRNIRPTGDPGIPSHTIDAGIFLATGRIRRRSRRENIPTGAAEGLWCISSARNYYSPARRTPRRACRPRGDRTLAAGAAA